MRGLILLAESQGELRFLILHPVTLVDNDVLPGHLAESGLVIENVLVGVEHDVELVIL